MVLEDAAGRFAPADGHAAVRHQHPALQIRVQRNRLAAQVARRLLLIQFKRVYHLILRQRKRQRVGRLKTILFHRTQVQPRPQNLQPRQLRRRHPGRQ